MLVFNVTKISIFTVRDGFGENKQKNPDNTALSSCGGGDKCGECSIIHISAVK